MIFFWPFLILVVLFCAGKTIAAIARLFAASVNLTCALLNLAFINLYDLVNRICR